MLGASNYQFQMKSFGLIFIGGDNVDAFITNWIGSPSGIMQYIGRVFYGSMLDRFPFKLVLGFQTILLTSLVGTLYFTSQLGEIAYVIWLWIIYMTCPGIYPMIPRKILL